MAKFSAAYDLIETAQANAKLAEKIYQDLAGLKKGYDTYTCSVEGDYVHVCDGQDRWFAETSDYEAALAKVVEKALEGKYKGDEIEADAYADLCRECPAIYSRIGASRMTEEQFAAWLLSDEYEYTDAEEVAEWFGVELPETEEVEQD